jgi:hypothetical protein
MVNQLVRKHPGRLEKTRKKCFCLPLCLNVRAREIFEPTSLCHFGNGKKVRRELVDQLIVGSPFIDIHAEKASDCDYSTKARRLISLGFIPLDLLGLQLKHLRETLLSEPSCDARTNESFREIS